MTQSASRSPVIGVIGLGYVGAVSAACLADWGLRVYGIDRDSKKVDAINRGVAPFFEPELDAILENAVKSGLLTAHTDLADALPHIDLAFLCVGTPSGADGNHNMEQLERVCLEIGRLLQGRTRLLVVAIRSTVFPGTCEELVLPKLGFHPQVRVVSHPEFLREGVAVKDFREPSLIVIGAQDQAAGDLAASVYAGLAQPVRRVSLRAAEMIKFTCNAFHALKISFANEVGSLAARCGVNAGELMEAVCADTRLNISPAYLKPGFAFGGSCLPKDVRALNWRATKARLELPLLASVLPSNERHLDRAVDRVLHSGGTRFGLLGLSFKEDTDDLRESPALDLAVKLVDAGCALRIWDPNIRLDRIYGQNKDFLMRQLPDGQVRLVNELPGLLAWADHLVITQKLPPSVALTVQSAGICTTDLNRMN